jgi:hypothetical protein
MHGDGSRDGSGTTAAEGRLRRLAAELQPAAALAPPALRVAAAAAAGPLRGKALLQSAFLLEEGTVLLNHGSYGAMPRMVSAKQQQLVVNWAWALSPRAQLARLT